MNLGNYIKNELPKWPNWINLILLRLNVFGELVYGKRYRQLKSHITDRSPDSLLLETVNFAIKNVAYYRKRYCGQIIHSKEEFENVFGFIDKDEVMNHWDEFLVDNIDWSKVSVGTTGGTSGKALKLVAPKDRYVHEALFVNRHRTNAGWKPGVLRAVIRNDKLPSNRDFLINPIQKHLIFDAFRMNESYAKIIYSIIKRFKVRYIHAYPSAVYQFFKLCEKQKLDLSIIQAVMLSSEAITDEQSWYIREHLGIRISCSYGHSEKLILAMNNCETMDLDVDPYYGYCEIIDENGNILRENGSIGELVGTSFSNKYQILIRYKTGDHAKIDSINRCENGIEFYRLSKIYGRWDKSLIYKKDGSTTSLTALNLHGDFYNHIDGMQYIQHEKGKVVVLLIKNDLFTTEDESFILNHVGYAMGGNDCVEIRYVDRLVFQPNGKFLPLISQV